jgi:hypothetical protein
MVAANPQRDDTPSPFDGLEDVQVLERAKAALRRVHASSLGSIERSVQWALYEQAKAELDMRLYLRVLRKIQEGK